MSDELNNIKKLLRALVDPVQDVETILQQLLAERSVDTAIGEQLNVLGRIVGQDRNGMVDDDYRRLIRARISVNRSKGTIGDIIDVTNLIVYDPATIIDINNHGPAALTVTIDGVLVSFQTAATLAKLLQESVSAGVRLFLETVDVADADAFQFDEYVSVPNPAQGFESIDLATGGKLGSVT